MCPTEELTEANASDAGVSSFKLDASGFVSLTLTGEVPADFMDGTAWTFSDLVPFMQGYVEALFADLRDRWIAVAVDRGHDPANLTHPGFSDLAPEALARIMEDCVARLRSRDCVQPTWAGGRSFWTHRQAGERKGFPPLTVFLADDGKVWFR